MKTGHSILVVDDEQNMRMILGRILRSAGYEVYTSSNGADAVGIADRERPDAVLLDLMMPGMSGREVCQAVRRISPQTKVIYFSARVESSVDAFKALREEADTFISKPASSRKILSSVSGVLN